MNHRNFIPYSIFAACLAVISAAACKETASEPITDLTLIPPVAATDMTDIDIRAGITNTGKSSSTYTICLSAEHEGKQVILLRDTAVVKAGDTYCARTEMETHGMTGKNNIILKITDGTDTLYNKESITIIDSDVRSTRTIGGAFIGICHWSEVEGKHWNSDIRQLTDEDWREMVRSMHRLGMDIIVVQELFRNEEYVGKHSTTLETYTGKAYYDSDIYKARMDIRASDPLEAIMSEADRLGMHVLPGIGMFAWFDFTQESLEWHKKIAAEIWSRYGHHESFYGFYVPEESGGSLDNWEKTGKMRRQRKSEIVHFFREFKTFCNSLAPAKPVMLATNSFGIMSGMDTYPGLLENLDILCPFGFARMPEGDLTGKQAADTLQKLCDTAGAHLWFDLEAFLFNDDGSLRPRDIESITKDLKLLDNFETIICYQYPGVFSDPDARIRVGEVKTEELFKDYLDYIEKHGYTVRSSNSDGLQKK